jgi:phospholipid/cholesterol/gamma-HCH transport system substrate-binding protein
VDIDQLFANINSVGDEVKAAIRSIGEFLGGGEEKSFSSRPTEIYAEFSNIGGLKKGAVVEIAGVEVGKVEGISLEDYQAKVKMQIESTLEIQEDAIASVKTKGIFGKKYIEITPGGSEKIISSGGKIRDTQPPFDLEKAISKLVFGKVSK